MVAAKPSATSFVVFPVGVIGISMVIIKLLAYIAKNIQPALHAECLPMELRIFQSTKRRFLQELNAAADNAEPKWEL